MTQEAVELAKSKNWMVCFVAEAGSHQFALYNGREGSCHDGKLSFKVTLSPTTNGTVKLVGVEDFENVPYGQVIKVEVTPDKNCELVSLKVNNKDCLLYTSQPFAGWQPPLPYRLRSFGNHRFRCVLLFAVFVLTFYC